ncbi:MAG: MFS transporter [Nakamurella sp.]
MTRKENSLAVLLRITAFRRMWLALSTSSLGDWLGLLATTALAAYLTKDSSNFAQGAAVSGVLVVRLAPDLILGPIAGAIVDRFDRRYVAIFGDAAAGLLYLSIPLVGNLTWLFIAQFLVEGVGLFSNPAKQTLWVNIVPRERLAVANQLNYVSVYGMVPVAAVLFALLATVSQFFGAPPVSDAGATSALISGTSSVAINVALVFDAATYFLAATVLFITRHLIPAYLGEREAAKSVFSLVREGIGFVKNSPLMRAIYVGILGAFAAGGLVAGVAQAYVATMGGGNAGYGILFGAVFSGLALGMLIGPKVLPAMPRRMVFTLGIGVAGVALVVMSLIPDFVGAAITSMVMGLFAGISWITGFTMIGHEVADRLRGRVFAFVMSSVRIMLLGTIAVGPILANSIGFHTMRVGTFSVVFTGPGLVLAVSGVLTVGVALFAGRQVGGLRGHFLRKIARRLLRGRRRELIVVSDELRGVFVAVVGENPVLVHQYASVVAAHLRDSGWRTHTESQTVGAYLADDSESGALRALAELSELVTHRIRPALEAGDVVVCADYRDAIVVRFGAQARLGEERMLRMANWSSGGLVPDVILLVDSPDTSDGVENSDNTDPDLVASRVAYQELAAAASERYVRVTVSPGDDTLVESVLDELSSALRQRSPRHVDGESNGSASDELPDRLKTEVLDASQDASPSSEDDVIPQDSPSDGKDVIHEDRSSEPLADWTP